MDIINSAPLRSLLLITTFFASMASTFLLHGATYPVGWNFLALFLIAAISSLLAAGIYRWAIASWSGALLMIISAPLWHSAYLIQPAALLASQYLPAALTGALCGEWLRYRHHQARAIPYTPRPSLHLLVAAAALLITLPLLTLLYASTLLLSAPQLIDLLMFAPHNTPFLLPSLLTALLIGMWLRSEEVAAARNDKLAALLLMVVAMAQLLLVLIVKVVFGVIEVA